MSANGEREKNLSLIIRAARNLLRTVDAEVFIPAISTKVRDESLILPYIEGYVFIKYKPNLSYIRLSETAYFRNVLCKTVYEGKARRIHYHTLSDRELDPMRDGMKNLTFGEFSEGDEVKIVKGTFKGLLAVVSSIYEDKKNLQVFVELKSKKVLLDYPTSYVIKL